MRNACSQFVTRPGKVGLVTPKSQLSSVACGPRSQQLHHMDCAIAQHPPSCIWGHRRNLSQCRSRCLVASLEVGGVGGGGSGEGDTIDMQISVGHTATINRPDMQIYIYTPTWWPWHLEIFSWSLSLSLSISPLSLSSPSPHSLSSLSRLPPPLLLSGFICYRIG